MPTLNLDRNHERTLLELLKQHIPEAEVWAFGSRVNGNAHNGSDLDLVVRNPDNLDQTISISSLQTALQDSNIPILVDIIDWGNIAQNFRDEIQRSYLVIQQPIN